MRGGDGSGGNVVTACTSCNTLKASRPLAQFLAEYPEARRNFFAHARYVWPRHLIAVAEELVRRGVVRASADFVEGVRRLRGSEAIANFLSRTAGSGTEDGGSDERGEDSNEGE
jgi:hypothetical protein